MTLSAGQALPWVVVGVGVAFALSMCEGKAQTAPPIKPEFQKVRCYTWQGGHSSSGAYSECDAPVVVVQLAPPAAPAATVYQEAPKPAPPPKKIRQ
ncbi:MAG TPA: hypothetical protein VM915_09785 [Verrucomicrobiae bacterium]|nr:hypothetical protein [Verrucomicrobiae bacterium]